MDIFNFVSLPLTFLFAVHVGFFWYRATNEGANDDNVVLDYTNRSDTFAVAQFISNLPDIAYFVYGMFERTCLYFEEEKKEPDNAVAKVIVDKIPHVP